MKFDDDDLKDGKLWAALQKEIDRDLAENGNGGTFQEELEDIEDSIETENENKETKSEYRIQNETANLSSLRSILEETERAKEEEMRQKKSRTNVEPETQDIEIPKFSEEEKEPEKASIPEKKKTSHVSQTTEILEGLIDFDDDPTVKKAEKEPEKETAWRRGPSENSFPYNGAGDCAIRHRRNVPPASGPSAERGLHGRVRATAVHRGNR